MTELVGQLVERKSKKLVKQKGVLPWVDFKHEILMRFTNQREGGLALSRFLSTREVDSYERLEQLLKDARKIKEGKGISVSHLMREVISRAPAGIKSLLLQIAGNGASWETFLREAENAAWIVFPEKILGGVEPQSLDAKDVLYISKGSKNPAKAKEQFCHYHGKGNHTTNKCEVVKKMEEQGWSRTLRKMPVRAIRETQEEHSEGMNKAFERYRGPNKVTKSNKNPFFVSGKIGEVSMPILIDTGADATLVSKRTLKGNLRGLKKTGIRLRPACGGLIEVLGKLENTEIDIGDHKIVADAVVTAEVPDGYAIIGTDAITNNKKVFASLIGERILGTSLNKFNKHTTRQISMETLVEEHKEMFKTEIDELTKCSTAKHRIEVEDCLPVNQRNIQVPKVWESELDAEVAKLLKAKVIRESKSPWASRVVPVKKKNGEIRMCIDFRKLNTVTLKDSYPLPRIDEIVDEMGKACVFSTLDATSGYYHIELEENDKEKTAFRWKNGLFEFNRMPFGLCNAPATFQRVMDTILRDISNEFVIPYLDDIIVYSKNKEDHVQRLRQVLDRIKKAGLALNLKKCKFFKEEIEILGCIVGQGIVKPDKLKVEALNKFKKPENIKELRSFLGLANYCRGFIPKLASMEIPLNALLKGQTKRSTRKIEWCKKSNEAFEEIKKSLNMETIRAQPNFNKKFILTTDASEYAIGAILSQEDEDGNDKMVYAFSKAMDSAQKNYSVTDKELLAVVKATEHFRRYLLGKEFVLRTDHKALVHLAEAKNPTSRMLRWALKLQEYQYQVEYLEGEKMGQTD